MATMRRFDLVDLIAFVLLVAAAAGARVWYLNAAADNAQASGPLQVQDEQPKAKGIGADVTIRGNPSPSELDVLVNNLKEQGTFKSRPPFAKVEEDTAHVAPGYPYFLSLLERTQEDSAKTDQLTRWVQAGLGALTAGFYYLIAVMAFRSRLVGVLAGLFCAVHPFYIVSVAAIDDGTAASFLLAFSLLLGTRGATLGGALTSLLYGISLAALALVRAALLPFAFVGLLWFLIRCRSVPRGWLCGILAFLGFVNGLVPWGMRNWDKIKDVVPVVNSTYLHLWMGNNPRATGGPMTEDEMLKALAQGDRDAPSTAERLAAQTTQKERYRILGEKTLKEVSENPAGTVRRRLWAGLSFFFGQQFLKHPEVWVDGDLDKTHGKFDPLPVWLADSMPLIFYGSTLGMLLLGALGWRWTYGWRQGGRLLALATIFVPLPYILSHAESLVGPRLPLDGVFLTYAAFALASLIPGVGTWLFRGEEAVEEDSVERRLHEGPRHGVV